MSNLNKINSLWEVNLTQEELDKIIEKHPDFMKSYYLQQVQFRSELKWK